MNDEEFASKLKWYHLPSIIYYAFLISWCEYYAREARLAKLIKRAPDWILRVIVVSEDYSKSRGDEPTLGPYTDRLIRKERLLRELLSIKSPK